MDYKKWIETELIPELVKTNKFSVLSQQSDGFTKLVNCEVNTLSVSEAFMMADCFKVKVTLSDSSGEQVICHRLVVKTARPMEIFIPNKIYYGNEITAYTELFPAIGWTDYLPKCYYYHCRNNKDCAIALEDFTLQGYRLAKSKGRLSLQHIYESVILMGKFHGLCYALKHNDPVTFNRIKDMFVEGKYTENIEYSEPWDTIIKESTKRAIESIRKHQNECQVPEEFLNELLTVFKHPLKYEQKVCTRAIEPFAILTHGDFLRNNIAFKFSEYYDNDEEVPTHAIMFDFQTIRYVSPMADLAILLAMSTSVDVKSKHFDYIFGCYHNSLTKTYCGKLSITVDNMPEFLRFESMLKEYVRLMPLGFANTYFLPTALSKEGINLVDSFYEDRNQVIKREYIRGGELVDRELRGIICDIYKFYKKYEMKLEHF